MLELKDVSKRFGEKQVLMHLNHRFPEHEVTGIIGPSGAGKTTLVNILLGLLEPDSGSVFGAEGLRFSAVFQEDRLFEHLGAAANLRLALREKPSVDAININLRGVGLDPNDRQPVSRYSGGMRRRVALVRAVLAKPDVLILDEPFKGLDAEIREKCCAYIRESCADATILLITHDPQELRLMQAQGVLSLEKS